MHSAVSPGSPLDELRPTVMDVDLDALEGNFQEIRKLIAPAKIMPMLKANAYGHGLLPCARVLAAAGAEFLGVAFLEEAVALREAGVSIPILAVGGIAGRQVEGFVRHEIDITASSVMKLDAIEAKAAELGKKARVHLKIDTGLERIGVHYYTAEKLLNRALACRHCEVVGIFSHFATSEDEDQSYARLQLERFQEVCSFFEKRSVPMPLRHMANSGAILQIPESVLDMARPGLLLYGVPPAQHLPLHERWRRLAALRSEVVFFKVVPAGAGVSYGLTWRAERQTRVVTLPVGYGDGFPRSLSNCGRVLIRGKSYPIAGRVCMDQFMVDIGTGEAYNGDEAVLIGRQGTEQITVEELARLTQNDPRNVLVSINARVPRRYYHRGAVFVE